MKFSAVPHTALCRNGWLVHPTASIPNRNLRLSRGVVRKLLNNRTGNRREIRSNLPPVSRPDFECKLRIASPQSREAAEALGWRTETKFHAQRRRRNCKH